MDNLTELLENIRQLVEIDKKSELGNFLEGILLIFFQNLV